MKEPLAEFVQPDPDDDNDPAPNRCNIRPQQILRWVFRLGAVLCISTLLLYIAPWAQQATTAQPFLIGLLLGGLITATYLFWRFRCHLALWWLFSSFFTFLFGGVIKASPIEILDEQVLAVRQRIRRAKKQLDNLHQQLNNITKLQRHNELEITKLSNEIQRHLDNNENHLAQPKNTRSQNLQLANQKLQQLADNLQQLADKIQTLQYNAQLVLDDLQHQYDLKKNEYRIITASHSALKTAANLITNKKDKRQSFEQSINAINAEVQRKISAIDQFLLSGQNLAELPANTHYENVGLQLLQQWQLTYQQQQLEQQQYQQTDILPELWNNKKP